MSELRLYLRRDSFQDGTDCAWALLDDAGQLKGSGNQLEVPPRARRCHLVLAGDLVLSLKASLPDLPERRLAPLLPAAAEAATLAEADSLHVALLARGGKGESEATLAVMDDAWFGRLIDKLAGLGLYPDAALPEYLLLPWQEGSWSVGWRGSNSIVRFGPAEGLALDDGEPPVGLALALTQRGHPGLIRVYLGDTMGAPDWERWRSGLAAPLEAAGAWDWRTASWPDLPNLLQGKHAPGNKRLDWLRLLRPLAWGALALAAVQMAGTAVDWGLLSWESAGLRREMHLLAERALPAHAAIVDPSWQVAERLQNLRMAAGNPGPTALVGLLDRLGQAWPAGGSNAQLKSLDYEAGALTVALSEADPAWLDQLKTAAAARGLLVAVLGGQGQGVRLSVKARLEGDSHGQ